MPNSVEYLLKSNQKEFEKIVPFALNDDYVTELDFSKKNKKLLKIDFTDEHSFCSYVDYELAENNAIAGIGGYGEHRILYSKNDVFNGEQTRSVHLGIDIWTKAGTPIFAPLDGIIHSFQVNKASGDYGPTIILEHQLEGISFYTLYGHLSTESLNSLVEGKEIQKGHQIATLGAYHENVHWPPHLHFQLIKDLQGRKGDYPGVAAASEANHYLSNCPDPNLILGFVNHKP